MSLYMKFIIIIIIFVIIWYYYGNYKTIENYSPYFHSYFWENRPDLFPWNPYRRLYSPYRNYINYRPYPYYSYYGLW